MAQIKDKDLRRRAKYLQRCRDNLWRRWKTEYLKTLRERHNLKFKDREPHIAVGEVVLIRGDEKNRGQWSIGVVEILIKGKDDVILGVRLKTNKSHVERAVLLLYPLELFCDIEEAVQEGGLETLNPKAILRHQSLDLDEEQQRLLEKLSERHLVMKTKN